MNTIDIQKHASAAPLPPELTVPLPVQQAYLPQALSLRPDSTIDLVSSDGRYIGRLQSRLWFDELAKYIGAQYLQGSRSALADGFGAVILLDKIGSPNYDAQLFRLICSTENPRGALLFLPYMLRGGEAGAIDVLNYSMDSIGTARFGLPFKFLASSLHADATCGDTILLFDSYGDFTCPRFGFFTRGSWGRYMTRLCRLHQLIPAAC